jgi:hypothetical protein
VWFADRPTCYTTDDIPEEHMASIMVEVPVTELSAYEELNVMPETGTPKPELRRRSTVA